MDTDSEEQRRWDSAASYLKLGWLRETCQTSYKETWDNESIQIPNFSSFNLIGVFLLADWKTSLDTRTTW